MYVFHVYALFGSGISGRAILQGRPPTSSVITFPLVTELPSSGLVSPNDMNLNVPFTNHGLKDSEISLLRKGNNSVHFLLAI